MVELMEIAKKSAIASHSMDVLVHKAAYRALYKEVLIMKVPHKVPYILLCEPTL